MSFATAYAGLALIAAALAVGPLNVLRGKPNPVSTDLRRDIGIWGAMFGIAHTVAGLNVHMHGHMVRYFVNTSGALDAGAKAFLVANWLGLTAALLLVLLLSLSNDIALRTLGTRRWKTIQQASYVLAILVVVHGGIYQIIEKRKWGLATVFSALALIGLILQWAGVRTRRKKQKLLGVR